MVGLLNQRPQPRLLPLNNYDLQEKQMITLLLEKQNDFLQQTNEKNGPN